MCPPIRCANLSRQFGLQERLELSKGRHRRRVRPRPTHQYHGRGEGIRADIASSVPPRSVRTGHVPTISNPPAIKSAQHLLPARRCQPLRPIYRLGLLECVVQSHRHVDWSASARISANAFRIPSSKCSSALRLSTAETVRRGDEFLLLWCEKCGKEVWIDSAKRAPHPDVKEVR